MGVDLTTVQAAASWANVTIPTADTTNVAGNIQNCVSAASVEFLRLTGRGPMNFSVPAASPFAQTVDYTEVYSGSGTDELFLRNMPINSVTSLTINGVTIPAAGSGRAGYMIGNTGRSLVLVGTGTGGTTPDTFASYGRSFGYCASFARGTANIAVAYNAGFAPQSLQQLASIPTSGTTPLEVTVASLTSGLAWLTDVGVTFFVGGAALTRVYMAPNAGEYYVVSPGVYLFNSTDGGKQVLISYTAAGTPADIVQSVNQIVALNYKRRNWIGQEAVAMKDVGSTRYSLLLDPEILRVVGYYKRRSSN